MTSKCPKGTIRRKAYTRKGYTRRAYRRKDGTRVKKSTVKKSRVPSSCIRDLGKEGKGKRLFTLKKGDLTKFGYSLKHDASTRRYALKRSMSMFSRNKLIKKLNALYILQKNTNPMYAKRARADMKWVQQQKP